MHKKGTLAPEQFNTLWQRRVYETWRKPETPLERVETDEAITMEDCIRMNEKLKVKTVKTLFLCNRQRTAFYLFITAGDKTFRSKNFSVTLGVSRVSFAPVDDMKKLLEAKRGAATVPGVLLDNIKTAGAVNEQDVAADEWYGCSDGTTMGCMKMQTNGILNDFLCFTDHLPVISEI